MSDIKISRARLEALEAVAASANALAKELHNDGVLPMREAVIRLCESVAPLSAVEAREANPLGLPWRHELICSNKLVDINGCYRVSCESFEDADFILSRVNAMPRTETEEALIEAVCKMESVCPGCLQPFKDAAEAVRAERQKGASHE
jgi:hypothetical protein